MNDFGMTPERIKQIRAKYKLTQEKMARLINVAHLTYVRWETGRNVPLPVFRDKLKELEQDFHQS
mgnify:CR=1 FL=1